MEKCGCRITSNGMVHQIHFCPKHAAVDQLLEAAKDTPSPDDDEGYCNVCNGRPPLERITVDGFPCDRLKHFDHCWFRKIQQAISAAEKKEAP